MQFQWDKAKASANLLRHGVDFADAAASGRLLVTAWTVREDAMRLISARKASAGERRRYASRQKGDR